MKPAFLSLQTAWIDQTLDRLSLEQQIAQLLHIPSWSNRSEIHFQEVLQLIDRYQIGGVIFFQGDPTAQLRATKRYQEAAAVPLMISIDAEWGLAMRLEETVQFPYQMTLGAIEDIELIEEMGAQLARQCRRLGIHVNFAPTVDINTEAANPVIGFRSFGSNPEQVAKRAAAYMRGMQKEKVLAVAKHFPGHGDTAIDSHLDLPVLPHAMDRLSAIELLPFRHLIEEGVGGVMTGHLHVPTFDTDPRIGATLSRNLAYELLQQQLGFEGLVFTDALDMKGVTKHFSPAEINLKALLAGHDAMLFCVDVPGSIGKMLHAVEKGLISEAEIGRRCKKLLQAKAWLGLAEEEAYRTDQLLEDLNPPESIQLNRQIAEQAITLYQGADVFPLPQKGRVASLSVISDYYTHTDGLAHHQLTRTQESGSAEDLLTPFQRALTAMHIDHFVLDLSEPETMQKWTIKAIREFEWVVVSIHGLHIKASHGFGITETLQHKLGAILAESKVILLVFGNAYVLDRLEDLHRAKAILLAYQETETLQKAAAKVILGEIQPQGSLPMQLGVREL